MDDLTLRPLAVTDASAMAAALADPELYSFTGGHPPTVGELARRYEVQSRGRSPDGTENWFNWVVLLDGHAVGYVQATVPVGGNRAEIAWVVGTPWQRRGVATRAVRLMLALLAGRGVAEVVAHIHPSHEASRAVARRAGLVETGDLVDGETVWAGPPL